MASNVLSSILSERAQYTAGNELAKSSTLINSLLPKSVKGESFATTTSFTTTDETSNFKPNSQMVHKMPSSHFVTDSFIVCELKAPATGTHAENVGLKIISEMRIRNGSVVQEIQSYRAVMQYVLARCDPAQRQQILDMTGGGGATSETVICPLPAFWNSFTRGGIQRNSTALPVFAINSPVEMEINIVDPSKLLSAGGSWTDPSSIFNSVRFVHVLREAHSNVYQSVRNSGAWEFWTTDFQTSSVPYVLPDGVETRIDVSFLDGSSSGLHIAPVSTANLTANNDYVVSGGLTQARNLINGDEFWRLENNISSDSAEKVWEWLSYTYGGHAGSAGGTDPTQSHKAKFIAYGGALAGSSDNANGDESAIVFESYYNMRDATHVDLFLTNNSGEELSTHVVNVRYTKFYIKDGQLFRRK